MKLFLKYIVLFFLFVGFTNVFSTGVDEGNANTIQNSILAKNIANKVIVLCEKKNVNLEVFISLIDSLLINKDFSVKTKSLLSQVNENLKNKTCSDYYLVHEDVMASIFWIGEEANSSNAYITNDVSAWDVKWVKHLNDGIENKFYFALPYNDFNNNGRRKDNSKDIPWYGVKNWERYESIVKNRWVKITYKGKTVFAQWEDVGPLNTNDVDYVFGNKASTNTFGLKAGIDLSPSTSDYLGINSSGYVDWNFVPDYCVLEGPWTKTITTTDVIWK